MNDTASSVPGASLLPDSTGLFTSAFFIFIALFALAVVAMIVIGIAKKRRRVEAEQINLDRVADAEETTPAAEEPAAPPPLARTPLANEPIAAAAPQEASPATEAVAPATSVGVEDEAAEAPVTQLKGLGPKVAARLAELDITTIGQLAALSDTDAARLDADLGPFSGRLTRDRWLEQARLLAAGDRKGFEERFGRLQ